MTRVSVPSPRRQGLTRAVLLAEPSGRLREKIAGVLGRCEDIWCVTQVGSWEALRRAAPGAGADTVLVDVQLVRDAERVRALRRGLPGARILGLVDAIDAPHRRAAERVGLDGLVERGDVLGAVGAWPAAAAVTGPTVAPGPPGGAEGDEP